MVDRTTLLLGAVGAYVLLVLGAGYVGGRGTDDESDFYVAGREMGWIPTAFSMWATIMSGGMVLGTVGLFYGFGSEMLGYGLAYVIMTPLAFWIIGDKLRGLGISRDYYTISEFLADRFDSDLFRIPAGLVSIIFLLPYMAVGGVSVGIILNTYAGMPYLQGVLLFYGVTILYVVFGGLKSVMYTDVIQGIVGITFFVGSALAVILYANLNPLELLNTGASVESFDPAGAGEAGWYWSWIIFLGLATVALPDRALRVYSVESRGELRKTIIAMYAIFAASVTALIFLGGAFRSIVPGVEATDQIMVLGLEEVSALLVVPLAVAVWAASMSSVDSQTIACAAIIKRDIVSGWKIFNGDQKALADGGAPDDPEDVRSQMQFGRVVVVALLVTSIYFAGTQPPFLWDLISLALGAFLQWVPLMIGGLFLTKRNKRGAELAWIAGIVGVVVFTFFVSPPLGMHAGTVALIPNVAIFSVGYVFSSEETDYRALVTDAKAT